MENQDEARPINFVAEINGHQIYRDENEKCNLYTKGIGWWGFSMEEDSARRTCEIVNNPSRGEV